MKLIKIVSPFPQAQDDKAFGLKFTCPRYNFLSKITQINANFLTSKSGY